MAHADSLDNMLQLANLLIGGAHLSRRSIERELGVSKATAKRYMVRVERALPVIADTLDPAKWRGKHGHCRKGLRLMTQDERAGT